MSKYETYLRDKEKMVLLPHMGGAVNVASAIAMGLVTHDDINEAPRTKRKRESTTSLSEFLTNKELDGEKA
jgi:hypothetical protein